MRSDEELIEVDRKAFMACTVSGKVRGEHIAGLRAVYNAGLTRAAEIARDEDLNDDTGDVADESYRSAIRHVIDAIEAERGQEQ